MSNQYYIYKMIHLPTGRVYIGQRKLPKFKTPETDNYHGSGVRWKPIYKAHPDECVKVIICEANSKEEADEMERKYIAHYKSVWGDKCVNVADGGDGSAGFHHTEEHKQMMREKFKGRKQSPPSAEQRQKISETLKNRYKNLPEEEKAKYRERGQNMFKNMSPEQ